MKILLISANTVKTPYPVYPLGLDYVAGAMGESRDVRVLDMNDPVEQESLKETLIHYAPDAVGVSLRNIDSSEQSDKEGFFGAYLKLIKSIRKHTRAPVILGGSGFSLFPDELMELLGADYGIVGEGERLPELLKVIEEGSKGPFSPGILKKGCRAITPPPWEKPPKRDFPSQRPYSAYYIKNGGMLNLQTKRGCNFRCIYCTYPHIEGKLFVSFLPRKWPIPPCAFRKAAPGISLSPIRSLTRITPTASRLQRHLFEQDSPSRGGPFLRPPSRLRGISNCCAMQD